MAVPEACMAQTSSQISEQAQHGSAPSGLLTDKFSTGLFQAAAAQTCSQISEQA